jgi:hypothetical protein
MAEVASEILLANAIAATSLSAYLRFMIILPLIDLIVVIIIGPFLSGKRPG